jgi:hypothetical protein
MGQANFTSFTVIAKTKENILSRPLDEALSFSTNATHARRSEISISHCKCCHHLEQTDGNLRSEMPNLITEIGEADREARCDRRLSTRL